MSRFTHRLRVACVLLCGLGLAACGPRTPNAAAETPFVPTSLATLPATLTVDAPSGQGYPAATLVPESTTAPGAYPPATQAPPPQPTADPGSYPAGQATATTDPYEEAATAPPAPTNTSEPVFITYRDFEIVPAQTTIRAGTTVNFLIQGGEGSFHQPYAGAAAPFIFEAPPNMGNGVTWPHTFDQPGTLTLLCGYHANMSATLIVEP